MSPKNDDTTCRHGTLDVIVTNQPEAYDPHRSHRAAWVCARQECVWDALGWVLRGTGEKAWWRVGTTGPWSDETYRDEP